MTDSEVDWQPIRPNQHHDWINQRSEDFYTLTPLYGQDKALFSLRSLGVGSNRDPWVYNSSKRRLVDNVKRHLLLYESEVERLSDSLSTLNSAKERQLYIQKHSYKDPTEGKWEGNLYQEAARQRIESFSEDRVVEAIYRPFCKRWLYYSSLLNARHYRNQSIFPTPTHENRVIQVIGTGETTPFSCLMSDCIPDLHVLTGGQCHPLYYYEAFDPNKHNSLLDDVEVVDGYVKHDAITDVALASFQSHYDDDSINKEGIFYYIYGVLHSPEYRQRYSADLKKEGARVPYAPDFHAFREAGETLAELHTGYESVSPYPLHEQSDKLNLDPDEHYRVQKMSFAGKRGEQDKSVIVVNEHLHLTGIPDEAHAYVVNGKTPLGWILERYQYTKDKDSGITNDPNEWSDDPRYIVDLIARVVTVSVETVRIVNGLPTIGEHGGGEAPGAFG